MKSRLTLLVITLVAFLIGVLAMAQFATQQRINARRATASGVEGALLISNLVEANARLRQEVSELNAQLNNYRGTTSQAQVQAMTDDLNRLKILNGAVEVSGPGVRVTLDGPATVLDLQDLVNELRNAGTEALSLNNRRIVASTVILPQADGSIQVDGVATRRPYGFVAIGDAATLETALLRPGGLLTVFSNSREGIRVNVEKQADLIVPAQPAHGAFQYAVPAK